MGKGMIRVGQESGNYELLGVDWSEKKLGVPMWGWGAAGAYLVYRFFFKKGRR